MSEVAPRVIHFSGRYNNIIFDYVHIDVSGLFETYEALLHRDQ
jgi:hypothetical protein